MFSLQAHIEAESARWASSRGDVGCDQRSVTSSTTASTADSIFSSRLRSKYRTRTLSRRSSTSSLATEFEPEPAQQAPFVVPRDFNGAPITVYASLEAAAVAAQSMWSPGDQGQAQNQGGGGRGEQQPRRLVTPGKLYENEEDDDEIVYE